MLVVGHPGQASVEGHHDEGELGERAQQPGAVPGEAGLKVKLRQRDRVCQAFSRSMEDTWKVNFLNASNSPPDRAWCTWRTRRVRRRKTS